MGATVHRSAVHYNDRIATLDDLAKHHRSQTMPTKDVTIRLAEAVDRPLLDGILFSHRSVIGVVNGRRFDYRLWCVEMASRDKRYQPPIRFEKQATLPQKSVRILVAILLPSAICAAVTIAVNKWVTQIGFLHIFLLGLPTPALFGICIGFAISETLTRSRWRFVMMAAQVLLVGLVYWQLRKPFHNPFP